jgi:hypothetical protein
MVQRYRYSNIIDIPLIKADYERFTDIIPPVPGYRNIMGRVGH